MTVAAWREHRRRPPRGGGAAPTFAQIELGLEICRVVADAHGGASGGAAPARKAGERGPAVDRGRRSGGKRRMSHARPAWPPRRWRYRPLPATVPDLRRPPGPSRWCGSCWPTA